MTEDAGMSDKEARRCYQYVKVRDPMYRENVGWVAMRNCLPISSLTPDAFSDDVPGSYELDLMTPVQVRDRKKYAGPIKFDCRGVSVETNVNWALETLKKNLKLL